MSRVLAGVTGLDLAAQLWRGDADLPVVVVSGWPEVARLVTGPQLAFVPKPLDMSLLLSRINAMVAPLAGPESMPLAFGTAGAATG